MSIFFRERQKKMAVVCSFRNVFVFSLHFKKQPFAKNQTRQSSALKIHDICLYLHFEIGKNKGKAEDINFVCVQFEFFRRQLIASNFGNRSQETVLFF